MTKRCDLVNWKKLAATIVILIVVVAAFWLYLVQSYESELGTSNVVEIDYSSSISNSGTDNQLAELTFESEAEDLLWSSMEISLLVDGKSNSCSFGSQSVEGESSGRISSKLSADGLTFTTEVDSTDAESFTYLDVAQQLESNESDFWMKFSSTDVFFGDGIKWKFIEGNDFSDVDIVPESELSNDTENRLEWYEYDLSVHRVNPNDGTYLIENNGSWFKIKFLTYYNSDDESRHPTLQIAALGNTSFPALENPDLVVPSPCKIVHGDNDFDNWNSNETIILVENGINICSAECTLELQIKFETIDVKINSPEFSLV